MVKIALAQINTRIGDLSGNYALIEKYVSLAKEQNADIVVFPELTIPGYPAKDLMLYKQFIDQNLSILEKIASLAENISIIVGFVDRIDGKLYNAAAFLTGKKLQGVYHKQALPNYDVFDEKRYFVAGEKYPVFTIKKATFGITICEDVWVEKTPIPELIKKGAEFIINISASPYTMQKLNTRHALLSILSRENKTPLVYTNLVGGNDELLFDGQSCVFNKEGTLLAAAKIFAEDLLITDLETVQKTESRATIDDVYEALVSSIKDYTAKHGFSKAVVGVSGGIDSAVTLALAVKALGKENVIGIIMPNKFTQWRSVFDARKLCKTLDVAAHTFFIRGITAKYESMLHGLFKKTERNVAEENIQARVRGNLLMATSNKFNWLVLATGNKSEIATGYCTLYGDLAGGIAVLGDVYKTMVYDLAKQYNKENPNAVIPDSILTKEPSAELRENQKDSDDLPPYDVLDKILFAYIEERKSLLEIVALGFAEETVKRVVLMIEKSEHKRFQIPPCFKISEISFGTGRRMPLKHGWRG